MFVCSFVLIPLPLIITILGDTDQEDLVLLTFVQEMRAYCPNAFNSELEFFLFVVRCFTLAWALPFEFTTLILPLRMKSICRGKQKDG